jgi:acyl-CoA synthetase (AMP-forming)/AMP-acid ligase II/thioesterase domain-containing protein/acyl carrier protein
MHAAYLTDLVASLAAREPENRILTFLYSDRDDQTITAGQLHRDASRVATILHGEGVRRGDILPLVFDHGYELVAAFWGAMYLGAVPTILPYVSPDRWSPADLERVERIARFTEAASVVTTVGMRSYLDQGLAAAACRVLTLPSLPFVDPERQTEPWTRAAPSDPPYLQFSSGTTGSPKAVILSHAAVLQYARVSAEHFAATPNDVTVGWLPLYHDMGLVNLIFESLIVPHQSVLMSPADWLREPHRLFTAVERFRGTITWMPNFAFRYCTRRVRDEQIAGVDLSHWRIVGNSAEPVLVEDLHAFAKRFAAYGLRENALTVSYGLAEHVAGLAWGAHDRAPDVDWVDAERLEQGKAVPADPHAVGSRAIVRCGAPLAGAAIRIVDDADRELAEREIGEVVARSPLVFNGYYRMPEESAAALRHGWLHTEDLGYIADGQLYVCGRKKDLIIVGGRNIHPDHLEAIAASVLGEHGRFAAAFGVPNPDLGTEMPVVVCELRQLPDGATRLNLQREIREQIRQTLQLFVADVHLVDRGWIAKTTSGKINRAANRAKYLSEQQSAERDAAPVPDVPETPATVTTTHGRLLRIWKTLFGLTEINGDDDFFALGGDSLLAAQLTVAIEEQFQCSLPATALLEAPTLSGLARLLDQRQDPIASPTLVPIQPIGTSRHRPAFFCVHGLGGGILDYRRLSQALGVERPFYGLQARGLDGAEPIDESIEKMAAHYVQAIKGLQPVGPYCLGGYCFGGIVAYEMARQLTTAGDHVALVAILEGYAPVGEAQRDELWREWRLAINFLRTLPYWLRDYLQLGRLQMQARNRRMLRVARKRLWRLAGVRAALDAHDVLDGVSAWPAQLQRIVESHLAAARRYSPAPYAGRIVLFRTPHRLLQAPERDMGWSRLSTEPVDVQMITGSHGTILEEPHVRVLAEKLRGFLR